MFQIEIKNLSTVFGCTTLGSFQTFLSVSQSSNELACTRKFIQYVRAHGQRDKRKLFSDLPVKGIRSYSLIKNDSKQIFLIGTKIP